MMLILRIPAVARSGPSPSRDLAAAGPDGKCHMDVTHEQIYLTKNAILTEAQMTGSNSLPPNVFVTFARQHSSASNSVGHYIACQVTFELLALVASSSHGPFHHVT